MRQHRHVAALLLLLTSACAGITLRETTHMPTMSLLWSQAIAGDVEHGLQHALSTGLISEADAERWRLESVRMQEALNSGDRFAAVAIDWPSLRRFAFDGIRARVDSGELGAGVGESFTETVNVFDQDYQILVSREEN